MIIKSDHDKNRHSIPCQIAIATWLISYKCKDQKGPARLQTGVYVSYYAVCGTAVGEPLILQ